MNANEALGYVLEYMPVPISNVCTIDGVLHVIFGNVKMEIQIDRPVTRAELNEKIRKLRSTLP